MEDIHITIRNVGSKDIINTSVKIGEYSTRGGIISSGKGASHLFFNHPITETALVTFEIEGEGSFKKAVNLQDKMIEKKVDEFSIIFNIDSDKKDVGVKFFKNLVTK